MADIQQAVRRLQIQATTSGVTDATKQLNDLARAQGGVAVASASTEKATESLDRKFASIEKRYISSVRAQADFEKTQRMVNAAVAQNPALQERANIILLAARERHDQLSKSQKAMTAATSELKTQVQAAASSFGAAGAALAAMGPAGIAAAAALGLLTVGFHQAASAALALADRAGKLKDFAETTGFTVVQLQALEKAGAQVGVSSESVTRGLERFSVAMDDVKKGVGPVYESILEINPALAQQMRQVGSLTEAWDVFAKAIKQADLEQANKLARSVFGRSGVEITRLARANADAGGLRGLTAELKEVDRITAAQAERWDELGDQINEKMKQAKQNVAAIFTEPVLTAMLAFADGFLKLSQAALSFKMSDEMKLMFRLISAAASTVGAVGAGVGVVTGWLGGGSSAPTAPSFKDRWGDTSTGPAVSIDTARLEQQKRSLAQLVAEQERWAAVMGAAVTPAQQLKLSLDKVRLAQLENKISAEQAAQATGVLKAQFASSQFSAYVGALGQAVTVEEHVKAKQFQLNDAMRHGANLTKDQIAFQLQYTRESALGITQLKAAADAERVRADTMLMGREAALAYEIVQTKINEARLKGAPLTDREIADLARTAEAYARVKVETDRYAEAVQFAKDSAQQFTSTLVQGLLSGKGVMESLSASAKQLASSLADSAIKDLFKGDFVSAGIKGVAAIGAAIIGKATEQDKSIEEAKKRWKEMTDQVTAFNRAAAGVDLGPLTSQLMQLQSTYKQLALAALEARDYQAIGNLQETFNRGVNRTVQSFLTASPVVDDLGRQLTAVADEGSGLIEFLQSLGPVMQRDIDTITAAIVRQQQELRASVEKGLVADIRNNSGVGYLNTISDAIQKFNDYAAQGVNPNVLQAWLISTAQTAVNNSKVTGEAFNNLITEFPQLSGILHQFTEEAVDSAAAIDAAAKALADATASIQAKLNTLQGRGYINDFNGLFKERSDALALGVDPTLVADYFAAQAQAFVDAAKLTGGAFNSLIALFPQLTSQVHEFIDTEAIAAAAAQAAADAAAKAAKVAADAAAAATERVNLQIRLIGATTDSSTLSGALALFDARAQQELDAAIAAGSSNLLLLEQVQAAERLNIVNDFAKRAVDAEKQLADQRLAQMQRIQQYLDNLTGGSQSTLSPQDRLAAAQSQYSRQLGLAQSGDADALANITSYSDNLLSAARDYYASSVGYQNILASVMSSLGGLAGASGASLPTSPSSIPGVSTISSAPVAANTNNDLSRLLAALNARIDAQTAEIVSLKTTLKATLDTGNQIAARASTDEGEKLDQIAANTSRIPASSNLALASPG